MLWLVFIKLDNFFCMCVEFNKFFDVFFMMVRWGINIFLFFFRFILVLLNLYFRVWISFDRVVLGLMLVYKILLWNCLRLLNCSLWLGGRMDINKGWIDLRIFLVVVMWFLVWRVNMSRVMCRCFFGISLYFVFWLSLSWMVFWICYDKVMYIRVLLLK